MQQDRDFATGGKYCLGFGGAGVDKHLSAHVLQAISPHGLKASVAAIEHLETQGSDQRAALQRQLQQLQYEAQRAFDQYDQVDPANRLVADVLEQRWNAKLEVQDKLRRELDAHSNDDTAISASDKATILALGNDFAAVWNDPACPIVLKKKIMRTLINEVVVDLDDAAGELHLVIHWHGGCHTAVTMPKPQSGAVVHKTALEDVELITRMATRYADDEIARVLSKDPPDEATRDTDILTLAQATKHSGVSDTTLMRLIKENILTVEQIAPYAPLEIKRADLDNEPVLSILTRLKETGKLTFEGDTPDNQQSLFE